ncbi:MAG: adenosylcobinamide-GDP ribazoletransferase [Cypionkella sp.]|nr:adenosylcobinamide-GDP ribazoletransferase [Cypionkella sp.]
MPEGNHAAAPVQDVLSAFGLLSRLPVPQARTHRAAAAWAFPLVGLAIGAIATGVGLGLMQAGLSPGLAAALMLGLGIFLTGAMHEDGLADSADGLFGGWTPERRLEIMKDSRIGTYGTLALITSALALWAVTEALLRQGDWAVLIAAQGIARAVMAGVMVALPPARKTGLSAGVGRPPFGAALLAAALALSAALALTGEPLQVLAMGAGAALAGLWVARLALSRIGGQTGDILGAAGQMALIAALAAAQMQGAAP